MTTRRSTKWKQNEEQWPYWANFSLSSVRIHLLSRGKEYLALPSCRESLSLTANALCTLFYRWWKLVDCDVKSGIDPLPFWLGRKRKILGFSQVLKPIKWQDLWEIEKMAAMRFEPVQKISAKKYFGGKGHFDASCFLKIILHNFFFQFKLVKV